MCGCRAPKLILGGLLAVAGWGVVKIELPEGSVGVAEPLRALMIEVQREAHANNTMPPNLAAVSARWAQVSYANHATVRERFTDAHAAQARSNSAAAS
jgi:hypothetical protein